MHRWASISINHLFFSSKDTTPGVKNSYGKVVVNKEELLAHCITCAQKALRRPYDLETFDKCLMIEGVDTNDNSYKRPIISKFSTF